MKILEIHMRIIKIMKIIEIACENNENHENLKNHARIMKIIEILEIHMSNGWAQCVTKYLHFAFIPETKFRVLWSSYLIIRITIHITIHFLQVMINLFFFAIIMFLIYVISVDVRHSCHNWNHFTSHLTTPLATHKDNTAVTKYCYFVFMVI